MKADTIVKKLGMFRHPEGGWYVETFRDPKGGPRGHSTAIYYLLEQGQKSHWHRLHDATEVWHHYAGAPMRLSISPQGTSVQTFDLGPDILSGEQPQVIVPANFWQSAEPVGEWSLVGCTVSPGFDFEIFELAPKDWKPTAE
ncbi:cupin domain-containing protein [Rhizobium sp. L1K21]|uniref:cupin domain-containing protein n=1 Tax=Rhizobium sp. L1K21 TaxID=2954933 RepID=UPI002093AF72|nr:cupin domain-containing protein [Rhizobium sp. L1K21]MCO6188159.1 cupin domain-containing protein [Rhizobium sp. L1K21]